MKRILCIIRPLKLDEVKIALSEIGVTGLTVSDVRGCGRQGGHRESFRGRDYTIEMPAKCKLEMIVRDEEAEPIIESVLQHAFTGQEGDGKIFVLPMLDAVRIRTDERGDEVL